MGRVVFAAVSFLFLSSCFYRPVFVDQSTIGTPRPKLASSQRAASVCNEVRRVKCDTTHCKGANRDLVTLNCSGGQITRCEIGKGGC
jgi:hypothetical protein